MIGWGILKLIPESFIRIFNSDQELLEKGVPALHIYFFGFCFMALQFTGQSVFVALGKAKELHFHCSKSDHCSPADCFTAICKWTGDRWCVLGRTSIQSGRRLCLLFHHAGYGTAGTEWKIKAWKK